MLDAGYNLGEVEQLGARMVRDSDDDYMTIGKLAALRDDPEFAEAAYRALPLALGRIRRQEY